MPSNVIYPCKKPIKNTLHYILGDDISVSLDERVSSLRGKYISTINCSRINCFSEMKAVQEHFFKKPANPCLSVVINFTGIDISAKRALELVTEIVSLQWGDRHQAVIAIHEDTQNLHAHIALNPVSFIDGIILRPTYKEQWKLKDTSKNVFLSHGYEYPEYIGPLLNSRNYFPNTRGIITVREIVICEVTRCAEYAGDMEEFGYNLSQLGYSFNKENRTVSPQTYSTSRHYNYKLSKLWLSDDRLEQLFREHKDRGEINVIKRWNKTGIMKSTLRGGIGRMLSQNDLVHMDLQQLYSSLISVIQTEESFFHDRYSPYLRIFELRTEYGYIHKRSEELSFLKDYGLRDVKSITTTLEQLGSNISSNQKQRKRIYKLLSRKNLSKEREAEFREELAALKEDNKYCKKMIEHGNNIINNEEEIRKNLQRELQAELELSVRSREREKRRDISDLEL